MSTSGLWPTGTIVVLQEVWRGKLWSARPMVVAQNAGDLVALWCPRGTRWKTATTPPTRERAATRAERFAALLTQCDWVLADFTWRVSNLLLMRPGDWHAVWVGWQDSGENWGWYINLQRPFVRTERGLQTMDLMLDIVVEPDRRWHWKDEDELDALVTHGIIAGREAAQVWEEAHRVVAQIEANEPPFSEPWHDWRPDLSWQPLPELPEGWEEL